jgi:acyl-CoA thioester hydrolase
MESTNGAYRHSSPVQIRFNDLDMLGHVNNAVHQNYFDLARVQYFNEVIGEKINWLNFSVVMVSIKIDYFCPIQLDDKLFVRSRIEMIGDKSLTMLQELYDTKTKEIKSFNRAVLVGYSPSENQSVQIPLKWKNRIIAYEDRINLKYPINQN